jgi:regulator of replication initiation timing
VKENSIKNERSSIEEDIILLKDFTEGNFKRDKLENYKGSYKMGYFYYKDIQQALEHILSDYKRVLKENEELKADNYELNNRISDLLDNIPVQEVKDKIEELRQEKKKYGNCLIEMYEDELVNRDIKILQELLEGRK